MNKNIVVLLLFLSVSTLSFSQKQDFASRLRFGGNLGATFGSYTSVLVSPQIGYAINPWVTVGINPEYIYTSYDYYNQSVFGMGTFLRGEYSNFFATTSYQYDRVTTSLRNTSDYVSSWWIGGGVRKSIGGKSWMYIGGSYNLLYNKNTSIYGSAFIPTIGVGVAI